MKRIVHFSCGAASAVAALISMLSGDEIELVYTDPGLEHKDNQRFLRDFENMTGHKVTILKSKKYKDPFEIFEERRFLAGVHGAPCTTELKKITARNYLGSRLLEEVNVFGFDCSKREKKRSEKYKNNNPELMTCFPLIDEDINKNDCYYIIDSLGLDLPYMYKLGYKNANCTGCVKAENIGYWAAIREDFPDVFDRYAKLEREFGAIDPATGKPRGAAINKRYEGETRIRVFLDEIPIDKKPQRNFSFSCGYSCGAQDMEIVAVKELTKEPSLTSYLMANKIKKFLNN